MQAFINNPVVGLVVCLVLGALAMSGKLSVPFANALLLLAWGVGTYELVSSVDVEAGRPTGAVTFGPIQ
jgi:hypothetical protein